LDGNLLAVLGTYLRPGTVSIRHMPAARQPARIFSVARGWLHATPRAGYVSELNFQVRASVRAKRGDPAVLRAGGYLVYLSGESGAGCWDPRAEIFFVSRLLVRSIYV
jgi:hypothetical protein